MFMSLISTVGVSKHSLSTVGSSGGGGRGKTEDVKEDVDVVSTSDIVDYWMYGAIVWEGVVSGNEWDVVDR